MYKIHADEKLLYSPIAASNGRYGLISPTVEFSELGGAGKLTFTMPPGHPRYDHLKPMKTIFSVYDGSEEIFRGRMLSGDTDFFNQKTVTCEGDLVFLQDSPQKPLTATKSIRDLFIYYIEVHNAWVESDKRFAVGLVTLDNADTEMVEVESKQRRTTRDAIAGDITDVYGGYLRTRTQDGIRYIDLIKEYGRTSSQVLRFGDNVIDLNQCISTEEVFSVVIPEGDEALDISSVNNGSDEIVIPGAIEKWGRIAKIVPFSGITDAALLKSEAEKWAKVNYTDHPNTITITAIDLKRMGVDVSDIRIGDRVRVFSKPHRLNDYYVCTAVTYDMANPGNTAYTFGRVVQSLSKKYAKNSKNLNDSLAETNGAVGRLGGGLGATASKLDQYILATDEALILQHQNILLNAQKIQANAELIALKAEKSYVNGVEQRLSTVEIDLNGDETTLGLKAQLKSTTDDFERRVSTAEAELNGKEGKIGLIAQVDEVLKWQLNYEGEIDKLSERMGSAEVILNGATGQAGLISRMRTVENITDENTREIIKTNESLTTVAVQLDATNSELRQTVVRVEGNESNYASLKLYVDKDLQSALEAKADKITLNGYVTIGEMEAQVATIETLISNSINVAKADIENAFTSNVNTEKLGATTADITTLHVLSSAYIRGLHIGDKAVSTSTIPVVTAFTQASGQTAGTTSYTILTTNLANAKAWQPLAGSTVTDFS